MTGPHALSSGLDWIRDRKGTPKNLGDKDFAELSGELSGAICLKALVLLATQSAQVSPAICDIP